MSDLFVDQILTKVDQAPGLYHRLVIVVAPAGVGKTKALRDVQRTLNVPLVNVNLEISRRMLELTTKQRALQVARLLEDIVRETESDIVLLDNIEIMFEISLRQDPLRLLQSISRNRMIVATWNGKIKNNHLTYAEPGHLEYKRYPVDGLLLVLPD